jgi:hypothetical protein
MLDGILVGCNQDQEWMLAWWWMHYHKYNKYPVAFVNFGMSENGCEWCRKKGVLIQLDSPSIALKHRELIPKERISKWEKAYGDIAWESRAQWFRKPFAMLKTPFNRTIWIDLDCEITGSLTPIFQKIHYQSGIAVARERNSYNEIEGYNSGVVAYLKDAPLLKKWAQACEVYSSVFLGDQEVLSEIIEQESLEITELSDCYNWRIKFGVNLDAVVLHWVGKVGKQIIRQSQSMEQFSIPL